MSEVLGAGGALGLGREVTWGTPVDPAVWLDLRSSTLAVQVEVAERNTLGRAGRRAPTGQVTTARNVGGQVVLPSGWRGQGLLWEAALWSEPVSTEEAEGLWRHSFREGATVAPSLTVVFNRGAAQAEVFAGCCVQQLTWRCEAGSATEVTCEMVGRDGADRGEAAEPDVAHEGDEDLRFEQITALTWGEEDLLAHNASSVELRVNSKLARRGRLGSLLTAKPTATGTLEVRVVVQLELHEGSGLYAAYKTGTYSDLVLELEGEGGRRLELTGKRARLVAYSDPVEGAGVVAVSAEWLCHAGADHGALELDIVNDQEDAWL